MYDEFIGSPKEYHFTEETSESETRSGFGTFSSDIFSGTGEVTREEFDELQKSVRDNKKQIELAKMSQLKVEGNHIHSDNFNDYIRDYILDIIWKNLFFVSSLDGPSVTTTSASEKFDSGTRQSDTSSGKFLSLDRQSRFRAHFYFNGTDSLDSTTYIGTCGTATTDTGLTSINQNEMEYIALKIDDGTVTLESKSQNGNTSKSMGIIINDNTTYVLEVVYSPGERAEFFLNNDYIGAITDNLPTGIDMVTFFPLMVSITRGASTNRTVTIESWEFIQNRV